MEEEILQEVQEIQDALGQIKPQWAGYYDRHFAGKGFIAESLFIVQRHRIFWVVTLATPCTFAYKEVSAEWVEVFSTLITNSSEIFVEFDKHHKIRDWVTVQTKQLPAE